MITLLVFVFTVGTYINFTMMRYMLSGRVKTDINKLIIWEQVMNLLRCVNDVRTCYIYNALIFIPPPF